MATGGKEKQADLSVRLFLQVLPLTSTASSDARVSSLRGLLWFVLTASLVTLLLLAAYVQSGTTSPLRKAAAEADDARAAQRKLELEGVSGDDIFVVVEKTVARIRDARQRERLLKQQQEEEAAAAAAAARDANRAPVIEDANPKGLGALVGPPADAINVKEVVQYEHGNSTGDAALNRVIERLPDGGRPEISTGASEIVNASAENGTESPTTPPPFLWPYREETEVAHNFTSDDWDKFEKALEGRVYSYNKTFFVPETVPYRCHEPRAWTDNCYKTCAVGKGRVPRLVHFMQVGDNIKFLHWLSVMSAIRFIRPDLVIVHYIGRQSTCWAKRIKAHPLVVFQPMSNTLVPTALNGANITELAHRADFLRLTLLWQYGGIYMDFDALITKSFDPLLHQEAVVSYQITQEMGNGLMVSRPRSCFICGFARRACHNFDGDWISHSVWTLTRMVRFEHHLFPEVLVLKASEGFFPFSYTPTYLDRLFNFDIEQIGFTPTQVYSLHLYNKMSEHFSTKISYDWIVMQRSPVAMVAKRILPYGFQREHMDEGRCLAVPLVVPA